MDVDNFPNTGKNKRKSKESNKVGHSKQLAKKAKRDSSTAMVSMEAHKQTNQVNNYFTDTSPKRGINQVNKSKRMDRVTNVPSTKGKRKNLRNCQSAKRGQVPQIQTRSVSGNRVIAVGRSNKISNNPLTANANNAILSLQVNDDGIKLTMDASEDEFDESDEGSLV